MSKRKIRILFYKEKKTFKKLMILFVFLVFTATLASCGDKRGANQKADADSQVKVLATVNDVPITEYDVQQSLKRSVGHGEEVNPEAAQNVLQAIVRDELIYQKSVELGLDKDQAYLKKLKEAEAQLRAAQRREMSVLYLNYVRSKTEVTDHDLQAYFEKNSKMIQTKYHVWQIMYRGSDFQIIKDHQDLKSGLSFEKVALRRFPNLPKEIKSPWDIGYLYWNQIPEPWQGVIDHMETGGVSDIITGPGNRFWVIKLVKKIVVPKITFASLQHSHLSKKLATTTGQFS